MAKEKILGVQFIKKTVMERATDTPAQAVGVIASRMIQLYGESGGDLGHFDMAFVDGDESVVDYQVPGLEVRLTGWEA